mgnify:CR=1 FL=1
MRRSQMTPAERGVRAQLAKMVHWTEFLHGTLTLRGNTCGKSGCRCTRGEKHLALYLTRGQNGKYRQMHIPRGRERKVKAWVRQYKEVQKLVESISKIYWQKLERREE